MARPMMKLLYAGIRVRDLNRSVEFYRKVMGMKVSRKGRMSHGGLWIEMQSPGSPQRLELNWYPPGSRFHTNYRKGEELDHLAFRVTDVEQAFREVTAKGARPEVEPFNESRYAFAFVSDPDGIWIELLGRVPRGKKRT
ncbi:MAG TPA: VOC family protein [Thermoplasmata archaeon]|nr:VOC family protein [Thermoplasmata archaeon]